LLQWLLQQCTTLAEVPEPLTALRLLLAGALAASEEAQGLEMLTYAFFEQVRCWLSYAFPKQVRCRVFGWRPRTHERLLLAGCLTLQAFVALQAASAAAGW